MAALKQDQDQDHDQGARVISCQPTYVWAATHQSPFTNHQSRGSPRLPPLAHRLFSCMFAYMTVLRFRSLSIVTAIFFLLASGAHAQTTDNQSLLTNPFDSSAPAASPIVSPFDSSSSSAVPQSTETPPRATSS